MGTLTGAAGQLHGRAETMRESCRLCFLPSVDLRVRLIRSGTFGARPASGTSPLRRHAIISCSRENLLDSHPGEWKNHAGNQQ